MLLIGELKRVLSFVRVFGADNFSCFLTDLVSIGSCYRSNNQMVHSLCIKGERLTFGEFHHSHLALKTHELISNLSPPHSGCYCALTVAVLLNLLTPELAEGTADFIASCQTFEGGLASAAHPFSGRPGVSAPLGEAHGGYTFCSAASWSMLRPFSDPTSPCFSPRTSTPRDLDVKALFRWAASVQAMPIEGGGFRGRTNKLVDGCYSWWCGGLFSIISSLLEDENTPSGSSELYDRRKYSPSELLRMFLLLITAPSFAILDALQQYVILAAQAPGGGLRDKPGKPADAYHTSYNLSGHSSAQHNPRSSPSKRQKLAQDFTSPFRRPIVEDDTKEPEMIMSTGENEEAAESRMREVYSRELSWYCEKEERIVYGDEESNSLVRSLVLSSSLCPIDKFADSFLRRR